jgi:hypothetical protein
MAEMVAVVHSDAVAAVAHLAQASTQGHLVLKGACGYVGA